MTVFHYSQIQSSSLRVCHRKLRGYFFLRHVLTEAWLTVEHVVSVLHRVLLQLQQQPTQPSPYERAGILMPTQAGDINKNDKQDACMHYVAIMTGGGNSEFLSLG